MGCWPRSKISHDVLKTENYPIWINSFKIFVLIVETSEQYAWPWHVSLLFSGASSESSNDSMLNVMLSGTSLKVSPDFHVGHFPGKPSYKKTSKKSQRLEPVWSTPSYRRQSFQHFSFPHPKYLWIPPSGPPMGVSVFKSGNQALTRIVGLVLNKYTTSDS